MLWRKVIALLRFIRPVNLLIMALTQLLVKVCLTDPQTRDFGCESLSDVLTAAIILATVLIAAGGNIYNDILDIRADRINKPGRLLITDVFAGREAMLIANGLTGLGLLTGIIATMRHGLYLIAPVFIFSAWLLMFYSRRLKSRPLGGNLAIALLSAITLFIVIAAADLLTVHSEKLQEDVGMTVNLVVSWRFAGFFMLFAFLTTFVRELVKDRQDVAGDRAAGYRTLAIIRPRLTLTLVILSMFALQVCMAAFASYLTSMAFFLSAAWMMVLIIMGLLLMFNTFQLKSEEGCRKTSLRLKVFMLMGLLTMILIWIEWNGYGLNVLDGMAV